MKYLFCLVPTELDVQDSSTYEGYFFPRIFNEKKARLKMPPASQVFGSLTQTDWQVSTSSSNPQIDRELRAMQQQFDSVAQVSLISNNLFLIRKILS